MVHPLIGIFYYYNGSLIVHKSYQKKLDPVTRRVTVCDDLGNPGEHRDLWDDYMVKQYPELVRTYDDNHKMLPRGRVGFYVSQGNVRFLVTLDKCIKGMEDEIIRLFRLEDYTVEFSYGTLNYKCRDCKG